MSPAPAMATTKASVQTVTRKKVGAGSLRFEPGYQIEPSGNKTPYAGATGTAGISAVIAVAPRVSIALEPGHSGFGSREVTAVRLVAGTASGRPATTCLVLQSSFLKRYRVIPPP